MLTHLSCRTLNAARTPIWDWSVALNVDGGIALGCLSTFMCILLLSAKSECNSMVFRPSHCWLKTGISTMSMFTRLTHKALIFSGGRSWPDPEP